MNGKMARAYERHKVFTNSKLKVKFYGMVNLAQPWFLRTSSVQFDITFNELSNKRSKYEIMENYKIRFFTNQSPINTPVILISL